MSTPAGWLQLRADEQALRVIHFLDAEPETAEETVSNPILLAARTQLEEYFAGKRQDFDLPIQAEGTAFQQKVWALLCEIPHGQTLSYQQLALRYGDSLSIRAIASANGRNPIAILIPCHRVIGSDGSLTGYAGGLHRKEWLLRHEGAPAYRQQSLF